MLGSKKWLHNKRAFSTILSMTNTTERLSTMLSFYYSQKLLNLSGVLIKDILHTENKTIFEIEM